MKCNCTAFTSKKSGYADTPGDVYALYPFDAASNTANLPANPLFQAYHNLYDEMKLIGFKVQISVTDVVGNATLPSLQIYTAFDRRHGAGEAQPTAAEIKAMSTMNVATALNNNVAKISRSIYASDLIEKAQWFDTDFNSSNQIQAWVTANKNPNFFCPAFYMCFGSPSLAQATEVAAVHFNVSVTYYVAFRCPKYGGTGSAKDLPVKEVEFLDEEGLDDDDDDMLIDRGPPVTDVERTINQSRAHRAAMADAPGPTLEPPERPPRRTHAKN